MCIILYRGQRPRSPPAIREITISGNKKLDDDAIQEVIDIPAFAVLNQAEIKQNVLRIRGKYLEKGFYLVEIEPKVHEVAEDIVELEFVITENKKVRVQRIDIAGNDFINSKKVKPEPTLNTPPPEPEQAPEDI